MTQEAYIVAGLRTAVGKAPRGAFRFVRPDDLAVDLLAQLMAKVPELDPARVEDLIVGNAVPEAEQGGTLHERRPARSGWQTGGVDRP